MSTKKKPHETETEIEMQRAVVEAAGRVSAGHGVCRCDLCEAIARLREHEARGEAR
jgi:hypothetical protein